MSVSQQGYLSWNGKVTKDLTQDSIGTIDLAQIVIPGQWRDQSLRRWRVHLFGRPAGEYITADTRGQVILRAKAADYEALMAARADVRTT